MNPLRLSQVAQFAGASLESGDGTVVINKISTDSRTIKPGELFVALHGENFDAHDFVEAAAKSRVRSLIATGTGMFQKISRSSERSIRCTRISKLLQIIGGRSR